MAFLAFCQMEGGTELQDQVERVQQAETAAGETDESVGGESLVEEIEEGVLEEAL
jgi:hypothetical protein